MLFAQQSLSSGTKQSAGISLAQESCVSALCRSKASSWQFLVALQSEVDSIICGMSDQQTTILALFLTPCISKRVGGDVAEWSKALPC